ncbi:MAG: PAS domain-containing protein [Bosea sp. (in: a-proteobacteria)]
MTKTPIFVEVHRDGLVDLVRNPQASFALATWQMTCAGADVPEEADFVKHTLSSVRPDLMVLRCLPSGDFLYEHYGSTIAAHAGFDMTGKRVSDFGGALGDFYMGIYAEVVQARKPITTLHRLGHFRERPLWERVILPTSSDGRINALYVINTVREIHHDVNHLKVRSRGNGLFVLQFEHDDAGNILDAIIVGANQAALALTGRRLDELLDRSATDCFPGIRGVGLWQSYLDVGRTRVPQSLQLRYTQDGVDGVFDVAVAPFHDGISAEFSLSR